MSNNAEMKALLKYHSITYEELGQRTGYSKSYIKTMMVKPLSPAHEDLFRKTVCQITASRKNKKNNQTYIRKEPKNEMKNALKELDDLCDELIDLDASKTIIVRQIRLESERDDFTKDECMNYIIYLRELIFKAMNER